MDIIECLWGVVGISERQCECFPAPEGEGVVDPTASLSGYFIDDSEDGVPLRFPAAAKDCGDDNVYDLIVKAKQDALTDLITDFGSTLQEFTLPRYAEIIASTGEIERNKNVPLAVAMGDYVGVLKRSRRIRGATERIERIRIRAAGNLTDSNLYIRQSSDGYTGDVVDPITFSASSGVLTTIALDEPIVLPLTDQYGNAITYAIVYERQSQNPYNYRLHCGCSNKPKPSWFKYQEITGLSVDAFTEVPDWTNTQNRSYGLLIDSRYTCRSLDWLCRPHEEDWVRLPYFRVVAKVIQLSWINKIIGAILSSGKINKYTMVQNEFLYGKRNHNRKEIADRLAWLAQSIPADVVDCYQCKSSNKVTKGSILV